MYKMLDVIHTFINGSEHIYDTIIKAVLKRLPKVSI